MMYLVNRMLSSIFKFIYRAIKFFLLRFTPERLQRNSDRFNTLYGGLEPEVTNTVFVHGQHDPWSVVGRRTDLNDDATAIIIPGAKILFLSVRVEIEQIFIF